LIVFSHRPRIFVALLLSAVSNVLLQVFDEGQLTDGQGRKVDFKNTIIIMTSNLGASAAYDAGIEEGPLIEQFMLQSVRQHFPPEFINRLDDTIVFHRLGKDVMPRIVDIQMAGVRKLLREQKVEIQLTEEGKKWLAEKGHDPAFGARPLKRVIYKYVLNPLAVKVLANEVREGSTVALQVDSRTGELEMQVVKQGEGDLVTPANVEPILDTAADIPEAEIAPPTNPAVSAQKPPKKGRGAAAGASA
jgi:ATP-dependent Clp protease ATP-binding subunit ClpA